MCLPWFEVLCRPASPFARAAYPDGWSGSWYRISACAWWGQVQVPAAEGPWWTTLLLSLSQFQNEKICNVKTYVPKTKGRVGRKRWLLSSATCCKVSIVIEDGLRACLRVIVHPINPIRHLSCKVFWCRHVVRVSIRVLLRIPGWGRANIR